MRFDLKSLELKDFNLTSVGISPDELNELLKDIDLSMPSMDFVKVEEQKQVEEIQERVKIQESKNEKEDEVPEVKETKVKLGDIYQLGNHRLMCGDSTDEATVSKLMNGEKADMVFTDPPYGVDYKGINNDDKFGLPDLLENSFKNYVSNIKSGSPVYVFHSDKCADIFHEKFRKFFILVQ